MTPATPLAIALDVGGTKIAAATKNPISTATATQEGPQPRDAARQTNSCRADPMTASGQLP